VTDSTTTEDALAPGTRRDGSGSTLVVVAHPALPLSRLDQRIVRLHQLAHHAHMRWRDAFVLRGSRMSADGSDEIEWRVQQLVDRTTTR
jgi:hypothetical protein